MSEGQMPLFVISLSCHRGAPRVLYVISEAKLPHVIVELIFGIDLYLVEVFVLDELLQQGLNLREPLFDILFVEFDQLRKVQNRLVILL